MAAQRILNIVAVGLVLVLSLANAQPEDDEQYDLDVKDAEQNADEVVQQGPGRQLPTGPQFLQQTPPGLVASPAPAAAANPQKADVKADAANAKTAANVAKQAAVIANKVAEHSVKVTGHAKKALQHALHALHDARVDSSGLGKQQKHSLKKAEAHLREATKKADFGKLKKVKDAKDLNKEKMQADLDAKTARSKGGRTEKEEMLQESEELRRKLKEKNVDDKDIDKALDDLEADVRKTDGPVNDESKAELDRLRQQVDSLEDADGDVQEGAIQEVKKQEVNRKDVKSKEPKSTEAGNDVDMKPVKSEGDAGKDDANANEAAVPVEEKGLDIDTQMPYGDLEPFGREDTAQELTESSIKESDEMVDQLERAEVAEEKRSVFRALTRLRGAAITSFDGVARSQTGNIDEYNKIHQWRNTHPLHHLADEESDVSKWAFPDNAD